jgi:predicted ATPase
MRRRTISYCLLGFTTSLLIVALATEIQTGKADLNAWIQAQRNVPLLQMLDVASVFLFVVIGLYGWATSRLQLETEPQVEARSDPPKTVPHQTLQHTNLLEERAAPCLAGGGHAPLFREYPPREPTPDHAAQRETDANRESEGTADWTVNNDSTLVGEILEFDVGAAAALKVSQRDALQSAAMPEARTTYPVDNSFLVVAAGHLSCLPESAPVSRPEETRVEISVGAASAEALPPGGTSATNLPISETSFIGREAEIAELKRELAGTQVLTLIGSEGIGKSRLAARLALNLRSAFPDGVWIVELPSISDTELVPGAAAWALNVQTGPDPSLQDALIAFLCDRKALLVFDLAGESNLADCARLVTVLAVPCPDVKFVICARKGLGLRDEAIYCVPALASSDLDGGSEAERLCRDRAAQISAPLDLDGPLLTELCFFLNGVPLAIELAIGGLASKPEGSLETLTRSLRDLTEGVPRSWEQTLQFVLEWSYQRLSEAERNLLERLSVFQSGWSLEAAMSVCCDTRVPSDHLPALLETLRTSGFVATEQRGGLTRDRLKDAVRNFAEAQLTRRGEAAVFRRRHAEYFMLFAEHGALGLTGSDRDGWGAYLERDYINFRLALLCLRQDAGGEDRELRLATALLPLLEWCGRPAEGMSLLTRATEAQRVAAASSEDYPTARSRCAAMIADCRATGDRRTEVQVIESLARLALAQSDFATAMQCYERAIEIFQELGDQAEETRILHCLGSAARDRGEYATARKHYERALELDRSLGRRKDEAHDFNGLAQLALMQGNATEAARWFQESLILFRELGENAWEAHNMGQILRLSLPDEPLWEHSRSHNGDCN